MPQIPDAADRDARNRRREGGIEEVATALRRPVRAPWRPPVLNLAVTFLVIALIAFVFGFGLLGTTAIGFAKIAFFVFLVLAIFSFFRRRPRSV